MQADSLHEEPSGCGYSSNSYVVVWLNNEMWNNPAFECIARSSNPEVIKIKITIGVIALVSHGTCR